MSDPRSDTERTGLVVRRMSTPMVVTPEVDRIRGSLDELERMGHFGDVDLDRALNRKRLSAIDRRNPATRELIARIPGVNRWLDLVPTAQALEPLYRPDIERLANGHVIGDELRHWLHDIADALGIRNRAAMLAELLAESRPQSEEPLRWLSLACGAAQPVLESAATHSARPRVTLVDLSASALEDARAHAQELGIQDDIEIQRSNVLARSGLAIDGLFDVVEAVGILEYLKPEDWTYRYRRVVTLRRTQAGAVTLLRNAWRLVRPGGCLIVGNMLVDRPQLGFNLNVVQWPHIQPRTFEEMDALFEAAGLPDVREAFVAEEYEQRVYGLYRVTKPAIG